MGILDFFKKISSQDDKETDLVCGMKVSKKQAKFTFEHQGKIYYFCSKYCQETFQAQPKEYTG